MTNYRRSIAAVAFSLLVLTAAAPASADLIAAGNKVTVSIQPTYTVPPGFDVSRANSGFTGGPFALANNTTLDEWITFCIERGKPIANGVTYDVKSVGTTASDGKTLSDAAAWLYESFRTGGLGTAGGAFIGGFAASNAAHTRLLQLALWVAQGYTIGDPATDQATPADITLATNLKNFAATQQHSGIVRIVQLERINGTALENSQDLLALQPVPEPASMLLLGGGLLGLAAARRRRAARQ